MGTVFERGSKGLNTYREYNTKEVAWKKTSSLESGWERPFCAHVWDGWCGGCLWRDLLIEVMSGSWSSAALFGRRNLRCLTIALRRVSGQVFLFTVRREISFFLWEYGRPELLSSCYILGCNSRTLWGVHLHLCASSGCLVQKSFHLAVHFLAGSHPGQATLGKSVKAWQTGKNDLFKK